VRNARRSKWIETELLKAAGRQFDHPDLRHRPFVQSGVPLILMAAVKLNEFPSEKEPNRLESIALCAQVAGECIEDGSSYGTKSDR
jgi:hypothetical protein